LLLAQAAWGHAVSMSSSDLTVDGTRATFELRIPAYEVTHISNPERSLLEHVRFAGAEMMGSACRNDPSSDQYICRAQYRFAQPVEALDVECTLAAITVPNHVHLLRAELNGKRDRAVFDASFTRATVRFRPPTRAEIVGAQVAAGVRRAWGGAVQILFLVALALAARGRRELALLTLMFGAGQIAAVLLLPHTSLQPAPRFVEAAAALAVAYLALEVLFLPRAGGRWMVAGVLGLFYGLFFHLYFQETGDSPAWVLGGALAAEFAGLALFAFLFSRVGKLAQRWRLVPVTASALLVFGMAWFVLRLRG
jgi:hypothetical protein